MKKALIFLISAIFALTFLIGCGNQDEPAPDTTTVEETAPAPVEDTPAVDEAVDSTITEEVEGETTEGH